MRSEGGTRGGIRWCPSASEVLFINQTGEKVTRQLRRKDARVPDLHVVAVYNLCLEFGPWLSSTDKLYPV